MIGYIKGILTQKSSDFVILETGGFGVRIFVNEGFLSEMPSIGTEMKIYTYTSVREDAFVLYGFRSENELSLFRSLITVNGIGPKGGLALLSSISEKQLRFAIYTGDIKTISKAPGIGKKTAERLILELKEKVNPDLSEFSNAEDTSVDINVSISNDQAKEAIEALTALGYTSSEAATSVKKANPSSDDTVEDILKKAFRFL